MTSASRNAARTASRRRLIVPALSVLAVASVGVLGGLGAFTFGYGDGASDFLGKWITKADNGFFHSLAFTTSNFHEPIQIKDRNRRVTQGACLHCHSGYVNHMLPVQAGGEMLSCVHCHSDVGHAQRN